MVKDGYLLWLLSAMHYPAHNAFNSDRFCFKEALCAKVEDAHARIGVLKMSEFTAKTKRYIFQILFEDV